MKAENFYGIIVRLDMYKMFLTFECLNEMNFNQLFTICLAIIPRVCVQRVENGMFGTNKSRSVDLAVMIHIQQAQLKYN